MKRGFTLIELLVVVLIIGILSAIALPQYQRAVDLARYTQALTLLENILQAEDRYKMANGTYTTRFDELDLDMPTPNFYSKDMDYAHYRWGKCWIHNTGYVACTVSLGTNGAAWAFSYLDYQRSIKRCWAYPAGNTRANNLCKTVTKNNSPTPNGDYYNVYTFL